MNGIEVEVLLVIFVYLYKGITSIIYYSLSSENLRRAFSVPLVLGIISAVFLVLYYVGFEFLSEYGRFIARMVLLFNELATTLFMQFAYSALGVDAKGRLRERYHKLKDKLWSWIRRQSP